MCEFNDIIFYPLELFMILLVFTYHLKTHSGGLWAEHQSVPKDMMMKKDHCLSQGYCSSVILKGHDQEVQCFFI